MLSVLNDTCRRFLSEFVVFKSLSSLILVKPISVKFFLQINMQLSVSTSIKLPTCNGYYTNILDKSWVGILFKF